MTAPTHLATLDEILAYQHPGTIRRYCKENRVTSQEAEVVFRELLKFLYLSARAAGEEGCAFTAEIEKLDWMWHTFLMFTRDYAEFCDRQFGVFIDHLPAEEEDAVEAVTDEAGLRAVVERQFALVYDVLGEDTLVAWYDECRFAV
ncbi:MAG: hypothetical protein K8U57_39320 [Planctomycetes bacterium]|nr:hypothetical protein [Planctomycetota bacterium]